MDAARRRAKIVATLGPATEDPATVRALVEAGVDVARLNLAHGSREGHRSLYEAARAAGEDARRTVAVLADLPGPKIRLGRFEGGAAVLEEGARFAISTRPCEGTSERGCTTYAALATDVSPGDAILVDDGRVRLRVDATDGVEVSTTVERGGRVADRKGINLPGVAVSAPPLDASDEGSLRFALDLGVDLVALSFVRAAADVHAVRAVMDRHGRHVPVIAKVEKPEAVDALGDVVEAFDAVMVARGDLGVELELEEVPAVQKRAIALARGLARPSIVATQMLESMVRAPTPTRAEVSDVANAVLDGADALMLSAETSIGSHPVEAVRVMDRTIRAAERSAVRAPPASRATGTPAAVARAAVALAADLAAEAIVAFTASGTTARLVAADRPPSRLVVLSPDDAAARESALLWGAEPVVLAPTEGTDELLAATDRALREHGIARPGDTVVVVAGTPPGAGGSTNTVRVHRVGERTEVAG